MKTTLIVVENDSDHGAAKALIEKLLVSGDEHARIAPQARLIEAYERRRWPRRELTVPELLTYLMDQHGMSRSDLVPLLGSPSRVSEIMRGKRELSMKMVKRLRDRFKIPADLLIPRRIGRSQPLAA